MATVLEQLQAIVRDYTGEGSLKIEHETRFIADIGLDSYDLALLLGTVEEHFGIEIPSRAAIQMRTAGDMTEYIERLI